uniref:Uncharacterized protein n=1 Tax=Romanomermis culicivorax TaxID=13658 RepID=A0A915JJB1_ROMCU
MNPNEKSQEMKLEKENMYETRGRLLEATKLNSLAKLTNSLTKIFLGLLGDIADEMFSSLTKFSDFFDGIGL